MGGGCVSLTDVGCGPRLHRSVWMANRLCLWYVEWCLSLGFIND